MILLLLTLLIYMGNFDGSICVRLSFTAGICIPVPAERIISTAGISRLFLRPARKGGAKSSVETAVAYWKIEEPNRERLGL